MNTNFHHIKVVYLYNMIVVNLYVSVYNQLEQSFQNQFRRKCIPTWLCTYKGEIIFKGIT